MRAPPEEMGHAPVVERTAVNGRDAYRGGLTTKDTVLMLQPIFDGGGEGGTTGAAMGP